jgi:hypothetical protein
VKERREQEAKNKTLLAKNTTEFTVQQMYYCAIFELAIHGFDTQIGWRDAFERQREYTSRDLFMRKLNYEKCSQRLQEMNRYLDFMPVKKYWKRKKPQL